MGGHKLALNHLLTQTTRISTPNIWKNKSKVIQSFDDDIKIRLLYHPFTHIYVLCKRLIPI